MLLKKHLIPLFLLVLLIVPVISCFSQKEKNGQQKKRTQQGVDQVRSQSNGNRINKVAVNAGNIIIGSPTNNLVTASIILEKDAEGFIEYSTESGNYKNKTSIFKTTNSEPLEINISGLKTNSEYYYRLNYREVGESKYSVTPESWFSTQKSPSTSFSLVYKVTPTQKEKVKCFIQSYTSKQ